MSGAFLPSVVGVVAVWRQASRSRYLEVRQRCAPATALFSAKFRPDLQHRLSYQQTQGDAVNPADYARMAEECSRQADAMRPSPERDTLIEKARRYRSYAKMDNWVASRELQPPS